MKNTYKIQVKDKKEFKEYAKMLESRDFKQLSEDLFEDDRTYVRILVKR